MSSRRPSLEEPLTFTAAARAIGWAPSSTGSFEAAGRRLRRAVLRREREIGRPFALRDRRGDARFVTLGELTRCCPELRPHRMDALAAELRPMFLQLSGRVEELVRAEVDRRLAPIERELRARMRGAA